VKQSAVEHRLEYPLKLVEVQSIGDHELARPPLMAGRRPPTIRIIRVEAE
jgi:hypothetical protein